MEKNLLRVRKKSTKRHKKKKLLSKVMDYLKSDDYMFAPILSAPPSSAQLLPKKQAFARAVTTEEPDKEDKKKKKRLVDEVWDYLKSDSYMYAPCDDPSSSSSGGRDAKIADYGRSHGGEKLLSSDRPSELPENPAIDKRVSEVGLKGKAVTRARVVERHEAVKYMVYQNCHT